VYIHVTLLPYITGSNELKSKPTQHSVKELQSLGIKPDILVCRTELPITENIRNKIALFCNVRPENVIANMTASNLYEVPLMLEKEGLATSICKHLKLEKIEPKNEEWEKMIEHFKNVDKKYKDEKVKKVKIQSCISFDNMLCHLGGKDSGGSQISYRPGVQLVLGYDNERYIRNVIRCAGGDLHLQTSKNEEDIVTAEKNIELFNLLIEKMKNNIYGVLYSNLGDKLYCSKEKFEKLDIVEQCNVIKNVLTILKNNASKGDLKSIGIKANGAIRLNNNISEIKNVKSIKLINQSVTGLFEQEIELLNL
jgi:hypothetical protein